MHLHWLNPYIIRYVYINLYRRKGSLLSYIWQKIDNFGSNLSTYPYPRATAVDYLPFMTPPTPHRPTSPWTEYNSPLIQCIPGFLFTELYSVLVSIVCVRVRGLRGRVVKAYRFETTRPAPLGFESHERQLSVANQTWLKNGVKHQFTFTFTVTLCSCDRIFLKNYQIWSKICNSKFSEQAFFSFSSTTVVIKI